MGAECFAESSPFRQQPKISLSRSLSLSLSLDKSTSCSPSVRSERERCKKASSLGCCRKGEDSAKHSASIPSPCICKAPFSRCKDFHMMFLHMLFCSLDCFHQVWYICLYWCHGIKY